MYHDFTIFLAIFIAFAWKCAASRLPSTRDSFLIFRLNLFDSSENLDGIVSYMLQREYGKGLLGQNEEVFSYESSETFLRTFLDQSRQQGTLFRHLFNVFETFAKASFNPFLIYSKLLKTQKKFAHKTFHVFTVDAIRNLPLFVYLENMMLSFSDNLSFYFQRPRSETLEFMKSVKTVSPHLDSNMYI